eukprot:587989-Rhodomonas_salina.1
METLPRRPCRGVRSRRGLGARRCGQSRGTPCARRRRSPARCHHDPRDTTHVTRPASVGRKHRNVRKRFFGCHLCGEVRVLLRWPHVPALLCRARVRTRAEMKRTEEGNSPGEIWCATSRVRSL